MSNKNKVYGYFKGNNYKFISDTKNRLKKEGIQASKSNLLELGVLELRKMDYSEIKEKIGELV